MKIQNIISLKITKKQNLYEFQDFSQNFFPKKIYKTLHSKYYFLVFINIRLYNLKIS